MSLPGLLIRIDQLLEDMEIAHAFGGALALAYYAEPRGTQDIDVNVFVPFTEARRVIDDLQPHGFLAENPHGPWVPSAGVRLRERDEDRFVDLFFSVDEAYTEVEARVRRFPFGPAGQVLLPFLSAEDLVTFKVSFGRPRDWLDIESMLKTNPDLDLAYVARKLVEIRGPTMRSRLARLEEMTGRYRA